MSNSKMMHHKHVDLLEEDKPIANQKFVCISFVSPEKIIEKKEAFYFEEFLKSWELNKGLEKFNQFMNFLSFKYDLDFKLLSDDLTDFCKQEKDKLVNGSVFDAAPARTAACASRWRASPRSPLGGTGAGRR